MLWIAGAPEPKKSYTRVPMRDHIGIVSAYYHPPLPSRGAYLQYRPLHGPVHQRRARAEIIAGSIPGATVCTYVKNGTTVWIAQHDL